MRHVVMSLNEKMHPRNPYKDKPPDFRTLADKYAEFRSHCYIGSNGKVHLCLLSRQVLRECPVEAAYTGVYSDKALQKGLS